MRKVALVFTCLLVHTGYLAADASDPNDLLDEMEQTVPADQGPLPERVETPPNNTNPQPEPVEAEPAPSAPTPPQVYVPVVKQITPFTGKIVKNKVRIRLQPSLESTILREANMGDFVIVAGETDDFYAVEPPSDIKAYIYRTYVLDGVVEGTRVNVRLEPDLNAPVIGQLNSGDKIPDGKIFGGDKKWIEFQAPATTRFYIAKDYVHKIGDRHLLSQIKRRSEEVQTLISTAAQNIQNELRKPFSHINIEESLKKLNKVINEYNDFPEAVARAKSILHSAQESFLQLKLADMEARIKSLPNGAAPSVVNPPASTTGASVNNKMAAWQAAEQRVYEDWVKTSPENSSWDQFYKMQNENAVTLQGVIEPYNRSVRNKPGDYILVTQNTHIPIAYLYSTVVNLQDKVGQNVAIQAVARDNNNFAFPAYFVLSLNQ